MVNFGIKSFLILYIRMEKLFYRNIYSPVKYTYTRIIHYKDEKRVVAKCQKYVIINDQNNNFLWFYKLIILKTNLVIK